jgi:hypothetical protein
VETTKLYNLNKLIITNAKKTGHDLSGTDFACQMTNDGKIVQLDAVYDAANNTLNISKKASGADIEFHTLNSIHFGEMAKDINLCDPST